MSEGIITTEVIIKRKRKMEPADYIIVSGLAVPLLYDVFAWRKGYKTVSVRFGNFLDDPKTRALFVTSWTVLTFHLFMKLPLPFQTTIKRAIIKKNVITGEEVVEWNV